MIVAAFAAVVGQWAGDPQLLLAQRPGDMVTLTDRHGGLLRMQPDREGVRFLPVNAGDLPPVVRQAFLAAEDRRFYRHRGVDGRAVVRAAWQNVRAGRIVSGGSTITMQLARMLQPRPRSWGAKAQQAALALRLESRLSKQEIYSEYLSRVPMGNRVVGVEAAARVYLGKPAGRLSPAEAALLAAVPRAPSRLNPWRDQAALLQRRNVILQRMGRAGSVSPETLEAALAEPLVLASDPFRFPAPHFQQRVRRETRSLPAGVDRVVTTLDPELQRRVEVAVRRALAELAADGVGHMAVMVLDVRSGEWLALEGSGGFWDAEAGQVDGSRALRQPGSALKPFTYAAAFEGDMTPATILPDLPAAFTWAGGTWIPRNYDGRFRGPRRARDALGASLNVPAAYALRQAGPEALLTLLQQAGISTLNRGADHYGLGLTLGAGEVRLDELAGAFAALLRGGEWRDTVAWRAALGRDGRTVQRPVRQDSRRICSPEAAGQLVDILADPEARAATFGLWSVLRLPFPAAVKTGTSEGYRDNWCVGGTPEVVVAVWCGNFDRTPMGNVSGVTGAGRVWREVMLAWAEWVGHSLEGSSPGAPPEGLERRRVCALSGMRAGPACPRTVNELLRSDADPSPECAWHRRGASGEVIIVWPPAFREWAHREGLIPRTVRGSDAEMHVAEATLLDPGAGRPLAILAPAPGDRYVLVPDLPRRYQTIELRCAVADTPQHVVWSINGREVARAAFPYSASWPLEPGVHTIRAAAGPVRSDPVTIHVY